MKEAGNSGFTLIELMISIVIVVIISSAVYFAVTGALESWSYCRDQLSLQKVLAETVDQVISGSSNSWGLKDSLEIVAAGKKQVEFVPPWIDDTHVAATRNFVYTLNKKLKAGAPVPIGEIRMPDQNRWRLVPVQVVPLEDNDVTNVKLGLSVPEGSDLRFIFHPDRIKEPDTVKNAFWDTELKEVMLNSGDKIEALSKNFFGVEIMKVNFSYYSTNNEPLTDKDWVDEEDLQLITGVQVEIEARRGDQTQKIVRFVNLRNAPIRTGYLTLRRGMKIPIPDSKHIKTFMITNLSGIANNDTLQIEAFPRSGDSWRTTIEFERTGSAKPKIKKVSVEYPPQKFVYVDTASKSTDLGVNLLLLGSDGLYDYDDDEETDDVVNLEGEVVLIVNEMTIEGAGLFIRP